MIRKTTIQNFYKKIIPFGFVALLLGVMACSSNQPSPRTDISLDSGWKTVVSDSLHGDYPGFEQVEYKTDDWQTVDVPHNWDDYGGYRRVTHGNRHGTAWYRRSFKIEKTDSTKCYFLFFEGVGSYATVWLNGHEVGYHAGGRTSFTLDVTQFIRFNEENILAVKAEHPANIRDLPWVCGGCSPEWGFCEGSQPIGIFRPVHLVITDPLRIEPFGVHVWNDDKVADKNATINVSVEARNYSYSYKDSAEVRCFVKDKKGRTVAKAFTQMSLVPGISCNMSTTMNVPKPHLWSIESPYLYSLYTEIWKKGRLLDRDVTTFGIRTIKWDVFGEKATHRFYLNGKPVFINGAAEHESLFGQSHAFSDAQIKARVEQFRSMGFNSFRDGHQPHNLRYNQEWDSLGVLWWPQMTAHVWYDTPEFRSNFKKLLTEWIKERRNSPSIILWGLENESSLPEDFAKECMALIHELDPTTSSQRLVTTCNGGSGTDWNVIQNWSNVYGGDPNKYGDELSNQWLNGEYGAWRSMGMHTEDPYDYKGPWSEDRASMLLELKIRLAEKVRDRVCGQYIWIFNSHDNPGRTQCGEGFRDIDRIGPVNYKGALTNWGEPSDLYYLYRSNYVSAEKEPMVYIVSHTWPDRWTGTGVKNGINIFTNCDEVELFNGVKQNSLGKKKRGPIGTHIVFDSVNVQYNVLYAVGYVNGKAVAEDKILLHHLPGAPKVETLAGKTQPLTEKTTNYIYRVNCGGDDYTDAEGNLWLADVHQTDNQHWGSRSWTDDYPGLPPFYGSQRQVDVPIEGSLDWPLLQTFRYGLHKLSYHFPLPDGKYQVELYFVEPWYGVGGGLDCKGWRLFDVAINDKVVLNNLDIWAEAGHDKLLKKTVAAEVTGGELTISFPQVKAGQAVISAIAISSENKNIKQAGASPRTIQNLSGTGEGWKARTWMDTGIPVHSGGAGQFASLAPVFYGAEWVESPSKVEIQKGQTLASFTLSVDADVYVGVDTLSMMAPAWISEWQSTTLQTTTTEEGGKSYQVYKKRCRKGETVTLRPLKEEGEQPTYPVVVIPVTTLDDPIDLRKATEWQAEDGKQLGNASKLKFGGKPCVNAVDSKGSVGISFQVGLASKYGLELRFMNWAGKELPVDVTIVAADGRVMWSGEWIFPATPQQWKTYRNDTQTTINAGTYTIKFTPKEKGPLFFDWMKVQ